MSFWSSLSLPWRASLEQAWEAYCAGNVPIGAVVTDADGLVVSRGRNRRLEAWQADGYIHDSLLAHAELNALLTVPTDDGLDIHTCILYTTVEPCPLCLGAIYMSGVRRFHYAARDAYAGSTNLLGTTPYLSRKPVQAVGPHSPQLELVCAALHVDYSLRRNTQRDEVVLCEWNKAVPEGVALGKKLFATNLLPQLCSAGLDAPAVCDQVVTCWNS
jgi:tRNA(adenine34) deaminase